MTMLPWDYSALAAHYDKRAPYSTQAVEALVAALALPPGARVGDIGAGTGRLSVPLAELGLDVTAVEPNAAMRAIGETRIRPGLCYVDALGESTGLPSAHFDLVSYGSSFNVLSPPAALAEACRLLRPAGAIALLFNHRDLDDPLQREIEATIRHHVPDYDYGARRQNPVPAIDHHGKFLEVEEMTFSFIHHVIRSDFIDGFRAHATLLRQAGSAAPAVLADIDELLTKHENIGVPFSTRVWYARRRAS